jgi:hypothetical protein
VESLPDPAGQEGCDKDSRCDDSVAGPGTFAPTGGRRPAPESAVTVSAEAGPPFLADACPATSSTAAMAAAAVRVVAIPGVLLALPWLPVFSACPKLPEPDGPDEPVAAAPPTPPAAYPICCQSPSAGPLPRRPRGTPSGPRRGACASSLGSASAASGSDDWGSSVVFIVLSRSGDHHQRSGKPPRKVGPSTGLSGRPSRQVPADSAVANASTHSGVAGRSA